ncbi:MAG: hypothetical protein CMJ78_23275 [Planctomycetaceae bacterium]|nr:hypothetical protein [Planctomycetaceae bacterium]
MADVIAGIKKNLVYEANASTAAIKSDISLLREFDSGQEALVSKWGKIGGYSAFMIFGGVFVGFGIGFGLGIDPDREAGAFGWCILTPPFIAFVLAITALVKWQSAKRMDMDNRRYEAVDRLLTLLQTDMASEATVSVKIDLGPHNAHSKYARRGKVNDWSVKYYVDPWLTINGRFVDGTKFTVSMIEKQQDRSKWKTNARGKTKHKSKTKRQSEAIVALKFKSEKYSHVDKIAGKLSGALQLPDWADVKSIDATEESLSLRTSMRRPWGTIASKRKRPDRDAVELLSMMFLSLYQGLNLSRMIDKAQS